MGTASPVQHIAYYRTSQRRQLRADLMRASGDESNRNLVMTRCRASLFHLQLTPHPARRALGAHPFGNSAAGLHKVEVCTQSDALFGQSPIALFNQPFAQESVKSRLERLIFCEDDQAASGDVETRRWEKWDSQKFGDAAQCIFF